MVVPEVQEARGRGSSRLFSARNVLELGIAFRLRAAMLPVAVVGAVLSMLAALGQWLEGELAGFALPDSLRSAGAPDLRVIVSDGSTIYFSLDAAGTEPQLFGGIPIGQFTADKLSAVSAAPLVVPKGRGHSDSNGFGGPEGSRFVRLEVSVTEIARDLPLRQVGGRPSRQPLDSPRTPMDARSHLRGLVGETIHTAAHGKPNRILAVEGDEVVVATDKSPGGKPVPISSVQDAMDTLGRDGEVLLTVQSVGYRSAFIGAVLGTLPDVEVLTRPARVTSTGEGATKDE